jgi:hypothetical protein
VESPGRSGNDRLDPLSVRLEYVVLVEALDAGDVVGVEVFDAVDEGVACFVGGLDEEDDLVVLVDRSLPAVRRVTGKGVHARGEFLLDDRSCDLRTGVGWCGDVERRHRQNRSNTHTTSRTQTSRLPPQRGSTDLVPRNIRP